MEENDSRNYFKINIHRSLDRTREPWICSQTRYRQPYGPGILRYRYFFEISAGSYQLGLHCLVIFYIVFGSTIKMTKDRLPFYYFYIKAYRAPLSCGARFLHFGEISRINRLVLAFLLTYAISTKISKGSYAHLAHEAS